MRHFFAFQVVAQYSAERLGRPVDLALVARLALRLEIRSAPEIARHRPQFPQVHLRLARPNASPRITALSAVTSRAS